MSKKLLDPRSSKNEAILSLFTCKKQIGKGVTSRVYKMTHNINHKSYALKEVGMYDIENVESVFKEKRIKHIIHGNLLTYEYLFTGKRPTDLKNIKRFDSEDSRPSSTISNENEGSYVDFDVNSTIEKLSFLDLECDKSVYSSVKDLKDGRRSCKLENKDGKSRFFQDIDANGFKAEKLISKNCKFMRESGKNNTNSNFNKNLAENKEMMKNILKMKERRYCYFISEYCEFTLRDFIDLRNDFYFNNKKGYSSIKCTNKEAFINLLNSSSSKNNEIAEETHSSENSKDEEMDVCFCDIETIASKNDYVCNRARSASVDVTNMKFKISERKIRPNICRKKSKAEDNAIVETKKIVENHFSNKLHNNKVVSYDTFGIKKRIPSCFLKASFTYEMKVNSIFFLQIIKELLNGLMFLHSYFIAHNDIKASNIFFNDKLIPKIGDFGMVISANENENYRLGYDKIKFKNKDKIPIDEMNNDLKQIGFLLFEMLWPMKTAMEKYKLISELETQNVFPDEFYELFPDECSLIKICITASSSPYITAKSVYEILKKL